MHESIVPLSIDVASTTWSTGIIPPSYMKTSVRFLVIVSTRCRPDHHIVALIKLDHAIAGIYMCAYSCTKESDVN